MSIFHVVYLPNECLGNSHPHDPQFFASNLEPTSLTRPSFSVCNLGFGVFLRLTVYNIVFYGRNYTTRPARYCREISLGHIPGTNSGPAIPMQERNALELRALTIPSQVLRLPEYVAQIC